MILRLSSRSEKIRLPALELPSLPPGIFSGLLLLKLDASSRMRRRRHQKLKPPPWNAKDKIIPVSRSVVRRLESVERTEGMEAQEPS